MDLVSRVLIFFIFMIVHNNGQFSPMRTLTSFYTMVGIMTIFNIVFNERRNFCSIKYWLGELKHLIYNIGILIHLFQMFLSTPTVAHSGLIKGIMKSRVKMIIYILFSFNQVDLQNMKNSKKQKDKICQAFLLIDRIYSSDQASQNIYFNCRLSQSD